MTGVWSAPRSRGPSSGDDGGLAFDQRVACGEESAAFGDAIARSERPDIDKTDGARITLHPGAVELAERNNMTRHLPDRFDCMVSAV